MGPARLSPPSAAWSMISAPTAWTSTTNRLRRAAGGSGSKWCAPATVLGSTREAVPRRAAASRGVDRPGLECRGLWRGNLRMFYGAARLPASCSACCDRQSRAKSMPSPSWATTPAPLSIRSAPRSPTDIIGRARWPWVFRCLPAPTADPALPILHPPNPHAGGAPTRYRGHA